MSEDFRYFLHIHLKGGIRRAAVASVLPSLVVLVLLLGCAPTFTSTKSDKPSTSYYWRNPGRISKQFDYYDPAGKGPEHKSRLLATSYNIRGVEDAEKGLYDQAIVNYSMGIELDPELAPAFHNRSIAFEKKGQFDKALQDMHQFMQLESPDDETWARVERLRRLAKQQQSAPLKRDEQATGSSKPVEEITLSKTKPFRTDTTPPEITITYPDFSRGINIVRKEKELVVRGSATDESGIVEVIVDNREAQVNTDGTFSANIMLGVGENRIVVIAMDRYGNRGTKEFIISRQGSAAVSPAAKPDAFAQLQGWYENQCAVVIGIDYYHNMAIDTLQNAVHDAMAVGSMLRGMGFEVVELYNEKATRKAIINAFSRAIKETARHDSFVFYFAGHGQGFTLETGERVGYVIPYDADVSLTETDLILFDTEAIPLNTIKKYSKNIKAKHIALLFDSCFSGLAMKRGLYAVHKMNFEYYNDLLSRKVINMLTAGDDQPVSDGTGHSPFTRAILDGLANKAVDINDRDGFATFTQLAIYVKEKVEKATARRQRPQFDNLSMEDGDFIFKVR